MIRDDGSSSGRRTTVGNEKDYIVRQSRPVYDGGLKKKKERLNVTSRSVI